MLYNSVSFMRKTHVNLTMTIIPYNEFLACMKYDYAYKLYRIFTI